MVQLSPHHPHVNLRLKFKKVGSLQYVSHLDLVRTMHKIIVRAKLPLWYTEGFNPKPKMIFAAPLSIGVESVCEYLDIKLIDDVPPEEAMRRLNANMTDEMQILEAYYTGEGDRRCSGPGRKGDACSGRSADHHRCPVCGQ